MGLQPCSTCHEKQHGKYANTTVAWWRADNVRVAWRLRICLNCYIVNVAPLDQAAHENEFACPVCHTEPGSDMDPTYITAFVPEVGKVTVEMATCAADAVKIRAWATDNGELLPDRAVGGQGPGPQREPDSDWTRAFRGLYDR